MFLDVVTETDSWDVLEATIVPLLLRSIGLSMGKFQSEELAIYKWSEYTIFKVYSDEEVGSKTFPNSCHKLIEQYIPEDFSVSQSHDFPLSMSCNILTLTLDAALRNKHKGVVAGLTSANGSGTIIFAGHMLWDLSNLSLQMLSQSFEHRASAIKLLLPFIFKAFARDHSFQVALPGTPHVLTRYIELVRP